MTSTTVPKPSEPTQTGDDGGLTLKVIELQQQLLEQSGLLADAQAESKRKQSQLEFVQALANSAYHIQNHDLLMQDFVKKSAAFIQFELALALRWQPQQQALQISACHCDDLKVRIFYLSQAKWTERFSGWLNQQITQSEGESFLFFIPEVPDFQAPEQTSFLFGYCIPLLHGRQQMELVMYFTQDERLVDVFRFQTMESARILMEQVLQRRIANQRLEKKYSEIHQAYQQLEQAQSQLMQSEKMANLGQLAAGVAHEINNPIGYVLSNMHTLKQYCEDLADFAQAVSEQVSQEQQALLQALRKQYDVDFVLDDAKDLIAACDGGLKRVQDIVAGLKSFTRKDDGELHYFAMDTALAESLALVANELKYEVTVSRELTEGLWILGNKGKLEQVFVNMLINAKQACSGNSGQITVRCWLDADEVCVSIADNGCGISKENQRKLFTPFFTTKPVGVGTGLGLSISYGILDAHNAKVAVDSEVGAGTTFTMRFAQQHPTLLEQQTDADEEEENG